MTDKIPIPNITDHEEKINLALQHIQNPFWFVGYLTDREREAVRLASRGLNIPKVIAPQMKVTHKVVYYNLKSAVNKINEQCGSDITFVDLTDLLLTLIEETLKT